MAEKGSKVDELRALREAKYAKERTPKPDAISTVVETAPAKAKRSTTKRKGSK